MDECQCPLGLIPHFYVLNDKDVRLMARWVSMPSRAYTSFLHTLSFCMIVKKANVSMPSRAYTSFLRRLCLGERR